MMSVLPVAHIARGLLVRPFKRNKLQGSAFKPTLNYPVEGFQPWRPIMLAQSTTEIVRQLFVVDSSREASCVCHRFYVSTNVNDIC